MNPANLLLSGLKELRLTPTEAQMASFAAYLGEIKKWNRAYSLTSIRTDRDIVVKHFLDSCLYLAALDGEVRTLADVGSGAGLPGIPIKILRPELNVRLIEPVGKKAAFLRNAIRVLKLEDIMVMESRVEEITGLEVDVAVTRALFKAGEFLSRAEHIVRAGGRFVLSKGPGVRDELAALNAAYELKEIDLPLSDMRRYLLVIPRPRTLHE